MDVCVYMYIHSLYMQEDFLFRLLSISHKVCSFIIINDLDFQKNVLLQSITLCTLTHFPFIDNFTSLTAYA